MAACNFLQRLLLRMIDAGKEQEPALALLAFVCTHLVSWLVVAGFLAANVWLAVSGTGSLAEGTVLGWFALEWAFFFWCRAEAKHVLRAKPGLTLGTDRRRQIEAAILDRPDVGKILAGWFLPVSDSAVTVGQAREWLAWYLHGQSVPDLSADEHEHVEAHLRRLAGRVRFATVPVKRELMRLTLDSFTYQHKPLVFYGVLWAAQQFVNRVLVRMGFQCLREGASTYWFLDGTDSREPVVFVHGIGVGLPLYIVKIYQLMTMYPGRRLVLLDLPYISQCPVTAVPSIAQVVEDVSGILCRHQLPPCSFVGHSYGTVVVAWMMALKPQLVHRSTLIDPVCFALWEPTLIKSFVYCAYPGLLRQLVRFYVARDLFITNTITRHFNWIHNNLLPEQITRPTTVVLSSQDFLINAPAIRTYLNEAKAARPLLPLTVVMQNEATHGSYLFNPNATREIIAKV